MAIKQKRKKIKDLTRVIQSYRLNPLIVAQIEKQASTQRRTKTDVLESILAKHYKIDLSKPLSLK